MTLARREAGLLAYFPEIYRDEILYSVIARYHRHVGNVNPTHTMRDLFGKRAARLSIPLPVDLSSLAARLPSRRGLDTHTLIGKTTHFNYYTAFRDADDAVSGRAEMEQFSGSPQFVLGTAAFKIRPPATLQFCTECQDEMLKECGEAWWRRSHQLPGVIVCPDHGSVLRRAVPIERATHALEAASRLNCPTSAEPVLICSSQAQLPVLLRFSRASMALLEPSHTFLRPTQRAQAYRDELLRLGISPDAWHIYIPRLVQLLRNHFGSALDLLSPELDNIGLERGIAGLARRVDVGRHPLLHLILEQFILDRSILPTPRRADLLECPNILCTFIQQPAAKLIYERRQAEHQRRAYECPCGYSFYLTHTDEGGTLKPRLRNFGPTLDPALKQLVADGAGLLDAMRATGLHARALAVAAARLSLPVTWKLPKRIGPSIGRAGPRPVKAKSPREPFPRWKRVYGPLRSWPDIDAHWTAKLPKLAESVLARTPPARVTRAELERQMGRIGYFDTRKAKLPNAWHQICSLLEAKEHFQARRVAFELARVRASGETPRRWKVLRAARVNKPPPEVIDVLSGVY